MKRALAASTALVVCLLWASPAAAIPITYDFEDQADQVGVTSLLAPEGVTLTMAGLSTLTAGISLNDIDFPPVSGGVVVFDSGGLVSIGFSSAVNSLSGFFTYAAPVTLTAFLNGAVVGSITSAFAENFVSTGNAPNEFLELAGLGVFNEVQIAGAPGGGSFTLDNLTVDVPEGTSNVPEPGTLSLMALGALALLRRRRDR